MSTNGADGAVVPPVPPAARGICVACTEEVLDARARRFEYAFTWCTDCGPRHTLIHGMPLARAHTTLAGFPPCARCEAEREEPGGRREAHAFIACPACGPHLLFTSDGNDLYEGDDRALALAVAFLLAGDIVCAAGPAGFELLVDATSDEPVKRLRLGKQTTRPFVVLYRDLAAVEEHHYVTDAERQRLVSPERPAVLLPVRGNALPVSVGLGNHVAAMLPQTALHAILAHRVGIPLVVTSGNLSGRPVIIAADEARRRLSKVADCHLTQDLAVLRASEPSVVRHTRAGPLVLELRGGLAPRELDWEPGHHTVLALGDDRVGAPALGIGDRAVVFPAMGALQRRADLERFRGAVEDLMSHAAPTMITCDLDDELMSSRLAQELARGLSVPLVPVRRAHALAQAAITACRFEGRAVAFVWGAGGLTPQGHRSGGDVLACDGKRSTTLAVVRPFRVLGGAPDDPRRVALSLLWTLEAEGIAIPPSVLGPLERGARRGRETTLQVLAEMWTHGTSSPTSNAVLQLFRGCGAMTGLGSARSWPKGGLFMMEALARGHVGEVEPYPVGLLPQDDGDPLVIDWVPTVGALVEDLAGGVPRQTAAARFCAGLAAAVAGVVAHLEVRQVALTGACFANGVLLEAASSQLSHAGVDVRVPGEIPLDSGGLALGQVALAHRFAGPRLVEPSVSA